MEINFAVKKGEILPNVESFMIKSQEKPYPPEIFNILVHKIISDVSLNPSIREFTYPFKSCPVKVSLSIIE